MKMLYHVSDHGIDHGVLVEDKYRLYRSRVLVSASSLIPQIQRISQHFLNESLLFLFAYYLLETNTLELDSSFYIHTFKTCHPITSIRYYLLLCSNLRSSALHRTFSNLSL